MSKLVFLVYDDEDDRMLLREALEAVVPEAILVEAQDGTELLNLLAQGPSAHLINSLPVLIILDMNMPKMTGLDALKRLSAKPDLRSIPTVLLSTSSNPELIKDALAQGVDAYLIKPNTYSEYKQIAHSLASRYLGVAS